MIQETAQRSGGLWQPSPGSMYPALSQLEDEGLIEVQPQDGKKAYALTEAGRTYVQENADALQSPWTPRTTPAATATAWNSARRCTP